MFSIDLACTPEDKDFTIAELWEAGCSGIVELDNAELDDQRRVRAFFDDDARQPELHSRFGGEVKPADTRDWVAFAHEYLQPMEIAERIFVCPEWRADPTPPGRIRIVVNAGLAFGTGAHETTRLCLEAIERHLKPGMTVVDVGTGSGILAEAALKLGAGKVYANDNDPEAVVVARENFERAGVDVTLSIGSAGDLPTACADLVLANISPAWIADLAPERTGDSERIRSRRYPAGVGGAEGGRRRHRGGIRRTRMANAGNNGLSATMTVTKRQRPL
jgi:ribosomal protein L11 methyltransferase